MSRLACVLVVAALAATGGRPARADEPPAATPPPTPMSDAELARMEADARAKAAAGLVDVAKFCEKTSAFDAARKTYELLDILIPGDKALADHQQRVRNKKDLHVKMVEPKIEERRTKALADLTALFTPVVAAQGDANHPDEMERLQSVLSLMGARRADVDKAFFEPYLRLFSRKDVERLTAGWEEIDGAWIEPAKVADLDKAHATWDDPWTASDEFIEVKTNQTLRVARTALAKLAQTRRTFLAYFQGEWDLRPPAAKLRVLITDKRADLDLKVRVESPLAEGPARDNVAVYVDAPGADHPTIACMEVLDFKDHGTKLDFGWVIRPLQREFARQIAWEYSRHNANPRRAVHAAYWAIDGIADFVPYVDLYRGQCVVRRPSWIPWCGKELDSAFTWCRTNYELLPTIAELTTMQRPKYLKGPENMRVATTLTWWLLEGKSRAYRAGFVKFLTAVFQNKDDSGTFGQNVRGVETGLLDPEFRLFCRDIRVEER